MIGGWTSRGGRIVGKSAEVVPGKGPARNYVWPPFEKNNTAALKHGAKSDRVIRPIAEALVVELLEQAHAPQSPTAYLAEVSYKPAVWAWARCEARVALLVRWLEEQGGDLTEEGEVRPAAELLRKYEAQGERLRARLGLDPLARARLGKDLASGAVDMAALMAAQSELEDGEG